jgi:hypothetical protein
MLLFSRELPKGDYAKKDRALGLRLPVRVTSVGCAALPAFPLYLLKADIRMIAGVRRCGPTPDIQPQQGNQRPIKEGQH